MNKIILISLFFISIFATAQVSFSAKAHVLIPTGSPSWKNLKSSAVEAYDSKGDNTAGFNVGVSAKVDFPVTHFYLMPEVYFTSFKSKVENQAPEKEILKAKNNRIDVPVLVGYKIVRNLFSVYVGPVASFNLAKDETFGNFSQYIKNNFTLGYQFGVQSQIKHLVISARYEGAFSKDQRNFTHKITGQDIQFDNRPSFLLLGFGYKF